MSRSDERNASNVYCALEVSKLPSAITLGSRAIKEGKFGTNFTGVHGEYKSNGFIWDTGRIDVYIKPNVEKPTSVETGAPFNKLFLRYLNGELNDSEFNLMLKKEVELS